MDPVGRPIAGATKTDGIHQGLQQQRTRPVVDLPVARHSPRAPCQDLAGQSFDTYPGQNQKPPVVDNRLKMAPPLLLAPADPLVPSLHLPGRRGPQQTGQLPLAIPHPVAQMRPERHPASEIVIPFHLFAPPAALGSAFHQDQFQRLALAGRAGDGRGFDPGRRSVRPPRTPSAQFAHLGKRPEALGLESLQQLPALVVLQPSVGPCPIQQVADGAGDLRHAEGGKLNRGLAHQRQFVGAERASAKG